MEASSAAADLDFVEKFHKRVWEPGLGRPMNFSEVACDPSGEALIATATIFDELTSAAKSRLVRVIGQEVTPLLSGGVSSGACFSPQGRLAFLSDHETPGRLRAYVSHNSTLRALRVGPPDEDVKRIAWSSDGQRLLMLCSRDIVDVGQRRKTGDVETAELQWRPIIKTSLDKAPTRFLHVVDINAGGMSQQVVRLNVWSAAWWGSDKIIALVSDGSGEEDWFKARLICIDDGGVQEVHKPNRQIGAMAGAASGDFFAFVQSVASNRDVVAGELCLIGAGGLFPRKVDLPGLDVSAIAWRKDGLLAAAGLRGRETVLAVIDPRTGKSCEIANSMGAWTCGEVHPEFALDSQDAFIIQQEAYRFPPRLVRVTKERHAIIHDARHEGLSYLIDHCGSMEPVSWLAPDDLELEGWLIRPSARVDRGALILDVHDGPIWSMRNMWLGRTHLLHAVLSARGYSIFLPNPRGSTGRGTAFQERIVGALGDGEVDDFLSGLTHVQSVLDCRSQPAGVMGAGYGGYMSCWLPIVAPQRFAAVVAFSPVTDWRSQTSLSDIGAHFEVLLGAPAKTEGGPGAQRSPIYRARHCGAAVMMLGGSLDERMPVQQIRAHAAALQESGVRCAFALYPCEGGRLHRPQAIIDAAERSLLWFERNLP